MPLSQFILRGTRPPAETQPHKDSPDGFHLIYDASRYSLYSGTKAQMDAQCDDFCQVHRRHRRRGPGLAQAHHAQKAVPPFAVSPSAAEVSCCGYVTNRHTHSGLRRRPPGTADGWRAWLASQRVSYEAEVRVLTGMQALAGHPLPGPPPAGPPLPGPSGGDQTQHPAP